MIIIKTANGDRFINESEAQSVTHNKEYGYVVITFKDGHSENAFQVVSGKWEEDPKDLALGDMTPRVNYKGSDDIMAAIKGATLSWATEKDEKEGVETPDDDTTNTAGQGDNNNNPPSGELEG